MAAAISSMEDGSRPPVARTPPSRALLPSPVSSSIRRSIRLQPRSPSSRYSSSTDGSNSSSRAGTPRITTTNPPSPAGSSGSGGSSAGTGGVWASLLSLGAAALPASLMPFSSSSAPPSPRAWPVGQAWRAGAGAGAGPRLTRHRAAAAAVVARASGAASPARSRGIRSTGSAYSLLSSLSSSSAGGGARAAGARSAAQEPAAPVVAAAAAAVEDVVEMGGGLPANGDGREVVVEGGEGVRAEAVGERGNAAAEVAAVFAAPAAIATAAAVRPAARAKEKKGKKVYLEGGGTVYTCAFCRAHLATRDHIVSECFHGHGGRAFLFERCVNVTAGKPEDRELMTGMHVVADITCTHCGAELGWKYESAAEASQKYKERKFILERCAVIVEGCDGDGYANGFDINFSATDRYTIDDGYDDAWQGSDRYGPGLGFVGWDAGHAPIAGGAGVRW